MTSDNQKKSPDKLPPRNNMVATFFAVFLAMAWIAKRGVDYLQRRYPNMPLLEAIDYALKDKDAPARVLTTQGSSQNKRDVSAEIPPATSRITPIPTETDFRADFNPNVAPPPVVVEPEPQPEPIAPVSHKPGTIFALLVGIDDYPVGIRSLRGCVNDITHFRQYLEERVEKSGDESLLQIKMLTNAQATRQTVVQAFRTHLGQAGPEDIALFYYTGHGAQSRAPFEFRLLEPDNKLESLVCYDSRTSDWDLADQELGQLIAEVGEKNPHIVAILDCCNSGTVTRAIEGEAVIRQVPLDPRNRPIESFLINPTSKNAQGQIEELPRGRHVVLSACQAFELAQEKRINGQRRGVFSYYLLDSLQRTETPGTYRDLFKRVNALVRANSTRQSPMVEATHSADLDRSFLGGKTTRSRPYFTLFHNAEDGWVIDGGAVHGVKPPFNRMSTWLSVFSNTTDNDDLLDIEQVIGYAQVRSVLPGSSQVQVRMLGNHLLDRGETYKAVVSAVPMRPMGVRFEGDAATVELVRSTLRTAGVGGAPSIFVAESAENYSLRLVATDNQYDIVSADDAYNLAITTEGLTEGSAATAVARLEHIARWRTMLNLQNSTSRLPIDDVSLAVESRDDASLNSAENPTLHLSYVQDEMERWQKPRIRVRVTNHSDQRLYCSVVALSQAYGIVPVRSDWVEPGDSFERNGRSALADEYRKVGITTTKDVYKVVVSTDEFDMSLAAQAEFPADLVRTRSNETVPLNQLEALLPQIGMRTFEADEEESVPLRDWFSKAVTVTTTRPQLGRSLDPAKVGTRQRLNSTVAVVHHPTLRANVRLGTLEEATRDLAGSGRGAVPPMFRQDGVEVRPLNLSADQASRSGRSELNILELYNIQNGDAVSESSPLEIHLTRELGHDDLLFPVSYDEEFYIPLGTVKRGEDGCIVYLHRLPEPTIGGSRTVMGAVRVLFQKLVGQRIGVEYDYPRLAMATISAENKAVTYNSDPAEIKQAVAAANQILLYIHGIFDDTRMIAGSTSAEIAQAYDLILTFDYENLDTPIKENAKQLFEQLQAAGFGAGSHKTLTIAAHSMGGLVSRSMIEQWGGNRFTSHLITFGTPHAGTPWAKVEDVALVTLTTVINGMTAVTWPLRAVSLLVQAIERFDTNLDHMRIGSSFLDELNRSPDPHVSYTAISGDTGLIPQATDAFADKPSRLQRMLQRLNLKRLQHQLATVIGFFGAPNDIAVSVDSAQAIPTERTPKPNILPPLPDDHMSFFRSKTGLKTIADNLLQND